MGCLTSDMRSSASGSGTSSRRLAPSRRRLGSTSSSQANTLPSGERTTWTTCSGVGPCRTATCTWSSPLPIALRPTDSGERFASVIDAPIDVADAVPPSISRFGLEELELLQRVHERWNDRELETFRQVRHDLLIRALLAPRSDPQPALLPPEHRSWIDKHAAAQCEFLAVSGFAIVGDLADLELTDARFDTRAVAVPDESRMLSSGIDAISELVALLTNRLERRERVERDAGRTASPAPSSIRQLMRRTRRVVTSPEAASYAIRRRMRAAFPSDRRTYYLHIGAPKSGSSYLQSLLWRNRFALIRDGVYLPGGSQTAHFLAGTDFRGRGYVTQASEDWWRGAWDRLIDDAERSGCRSIVISSEFLSTAGADEISANLGGSVTPRSMSSMRCGTLQGSWHRSGSKG